jgi:hypothetical protein
MVNTHEMLALFLLEIINAQLDIYMHLFRLFTTSRRRQDLTACSDE